MLTKSNVFNAGTLDPLRFRQVRMVWEEVIVATQANLLSYGVGSLQLG